MFDHQIIAFSILGEGKGIKPNGSHQEVWIEHSEGSEIWYWRDQETGQWMRHQ